jgi:exosortase
MDAAAPAPARLARGGAYATLSIAATVILFIATVLVFLFGHIAADMFDDWWNEPSLSQGLLIPPLAIFFVWLDKRALAAIRSRPAAPGLIVLACGCVVYLIGKLGAEYFLQRISMVVVLTGLIWTLWGAQILARLTFPLILLATMVPLPAIVYNTVTAPLQLFASAAAARLAQMWGVSVYRDGNIIQLAQISLGIDEACSGLNSFSAMVVASLLLGYFLCSRLTSRILLVLLSAPLSIAVNILRIAVTAILADYDTQFALGFYHLFAGWLVFLAGFGALLLLARILHKLENKTFAAL